VAGLNGDDPSGLEATQHVGEGVLTEGERLRDPFLGERERRELIDADRPLGREVSEDAMGDSDRLGGG
jgi:hypothetical protein